MGSTFRAIGQSPTRNALVSEIRRDCKAFSGKPAADRRQRSLLLPVAGGRKRKDETATEPAAIGGGRGRRRERCDKHFSETDQAGSVERPQAFGAHRALRACAWPCTPCGVVLWSSRESDPSTPLAFLPLHRAGRIVRLFSSSGNGPLAGSTRRTTAIAVGSWDWPKSRPTKWRGSLAFVPVAR